MKNKIIKTLKVCSILVVLFAIIVLGVDRYIEISGKYYEKNTQNVETSDAIIILGAYVFPDGRVSDMLADRLETGLRLYQAKKAPKILVSGDHGRKDYDEVNTMRKYLLEKGVPEEDIFMDHAGFDTYNSIYRAMAIFQVKKAIVVSQEFHLIRALYISRNLGLDVNGVSADLHVYPGLKYYRLREVGARLKAFVQAAIIKPKPVFLGDPIPISGSGKQTLDK